MKKTLLRIFAALVVLAVCAVLIARFMFPLRLSGLVIGLKLWSAGVRPFYTSEISGFVRDGCDPQDPEARGCTCIALIHGLGDEPETWNKLLTAPKKVWAKPVRLYALRVLRNERFLNGDAAENYRVRNQATQIADALAPLCPSWVVVGNSMGAWEAAWIALDRKIKVTRLLLMDGVGTKSSVSAGKLFLDPPSIESLQDLAKRVYYKPHPIPADVWPHILKKAEAARLGDILRAQKDEDFLDGRLNFLRLPTLVLWGAGDRLVPDTIGKELQARIPGASFREVPECGHVPQKECPLSVIQAIDDLLRMGAS